MKTLIVFATKTGCTEKCAAMVAAKLNGQVDLCNLQADGVPELTQYDQVIVGGPIRMGKIKKEVSEFCTKNLNLLKQKKLGLFICCFREGEIAEAELNVAFPQELLTMAAAREYFGGEFIFKKLNLLDKLIVKKVVKINTDTSNILEDNIDRFVQLMNN